jgi:site-specific recombinase XerD
MKIFRLEDRIGDRLLQQYQSYLRSDLGLSENSVHVYVPYIRDFLAAQAKRASQFFQRSFNALIIREYLVETTRGRSDEYRRLLAVSLRSFFRFLFLYGHVPQDLSTSVPVVRKYRQSVPPVFLSPDEVERTLSAIDQSTARGRRNYAVVLLLARLGLRASEVALLELDDIHWRIGEIVIRGKGGIVEPLPLVSDVGEALAMYIRRDRGVSPTRRLFLRHYPPVLGFGGPAAVGHIVRSVLARAGIRRSGRGAAHLFRHGLATKMIRRGATLSEISEVLRHRSHTTTAIYTQVSFEALRSVAQPWPAAGGER